MSAWADRWAAVAVSGWCLICTLTTAQAQSASEKRFDLHLSQGQVPASDRVLRVTKGDAVQLHISSDETGELHLHAYHQQARVAPGAAVELTFVAHASGRYRLEWHSTSPAPSTGHHTPPVAVLEVRPK